MANREREVGFLIKAKQQSKKAIDDTADALEHLDKIQADFGKTASKTGSLVERLQGAMADLDREIQGLSALNTVAANMDKAAQAVGRLDAEVRKSADSEEQLMRQMDAAAVATARAQKNAQFLKEARDQQRKVVAALTADEKKNTAVYEQQKSLRDDLNKAYTRAEAAVSRAQNAEDKLYSSLLSTENATNHLRDAFNEANAELSEIATLANRASSALGGVEATQEAVARASAKATAELERVNNAIRSSSGGGSARLLQGGAVGGAANSSDAIQALKAYKAAEVELQRLTEEIARAGGASVEMQRDLDVQTAAVAKAAREYQALRDSLVDAAIARKSLKSAGDVTASGTSGVANVPSSVPSSMREATKEGNSLRDAFKGIYGESRQAMSLLQRFGGEVLSLTSSFVGLYAAIEGISSVIQTAIAYQSVYNKLGVVFGDDVAGTRAEVSFLASEANRLGIAFTTLATNYSSFAVAANGANFSLEDTRKIYAAVAEAGVVLNTTNEDMAGIFKALEQIMSKGKVQAEELRGQLGDRMTGAFRLMADAIGVTTGELDKMLKQGEVVADRSTLTKFADTLNEKYGKQLPKALQGTNAEIGRFQNNLVQAENRVANSGFMDAFTESLRELNTYFQSPAGQQFFENIGVALGKLVSVLPAVVKNIGFFVTAFQVFAGFKVASIIGGLIGSFGGLKLATSQARIDIAGLVAALQLYGVAASGTVAASSRAAAAALVSFRGVAIATAGAVRALWAAIGGFPGLIMTAITTLASVILPGLLTGVDRLSEALNQHEEVVGRVQAAYTKAGDSAKNWADVLKQVTVTELIANNLKLADSLSVLRRDVAALAISLGDANTQAAVDDLTSKFAQGKISAEDFTTAIDRLAEANPELDKKVIAQLIAVAQKAAKAEDAVRQNNAAMNLLRGSATDADKAVLGLNNSLSGLNDAASDTSGLDAYTQAMDRLAARIPALKKAGDLAKGLQDNQSDYEAGARSIAAKGLPGINVSDFYFKRENKDKLKGLLNPAQAKMLDALAGRANQADTATQDANTPKTPKSRGKTPAQLQAEFNAELEKTIKARQFEIDQIGKSEREQTIAKAIEDARLKAAEQKVVFTKEQEDNLRAAVGAEYDAQQAEKLRVQIQQKQLELTEARGQMITREQYIMRALGIDTLANLSAQQQALAGIAGEMYDIAKAEKERSKAIEERKKLEDNLDKPVQAYSDQQAALMDAVEFAREQGDIATATRLEEQLKKVNEAYLKALEAKRAYWDALALDGNPEAQAELDRIDLLIAKLKVLDNKVLVTGKQINEQISQGLAGAFDNFAKSVGEGKDAFESAGDAFLQFASEFLRQIAQMIIQQIVFNILSGGGQNGGIGGAIAGVINKNVPVHHSGGIAGVGYAPTRSVYATAFSNAVRYHGGGIAGLRPGEVPAILQKGEGVFTQDQMKALGSGGSGSQPIDVKNVNLFDLKGLGQAMLKDTDVQKVLFNIISENPRAFAAAMGGR